ncbi:3-deoxy-7-phosphoheptulonate synthase [Streptomyces wedmorensis]|uniref:Phospho-2-dehydro-3-deoxyheptonate aldolase n=1 Tax=Streptomyces wedmorensis TaxID=43759 RepID=A0ABW6IWZ5_STRWE
MSSPDSPVDDATARAEPVGSPGPVTREETEVLRVLLARAAAGECQVLQAGDRVEGPRHAGDPAAVARETGLLDALAGIMRVNSGRPVVRIGREGANDGPRPAGEPMWTSRHVLSSDDDLPFLRGTPTGRILLTSAHLPWLGERALRLDGPHARMLARVANPLACEVGPDTAPDELVRLCRLLDPDRTPGRLTLVSRMGVSRVASELPRLVTAVRRAGHPSAWLCDPMGGNTFTARSGHRSSLVSMVIEEVVAFQRAVVEAGGVAAGLRLLTTPDSVTECAWGFVDVDRVAGRSASPGDPRLNAQQAFTVVGAWGPPRLDVGA